MTEQATYENLGRMLRNARLAQRIQLSDIAHALHIRQRYLEALENGELERLPGNTFVTGYMARYASHLGLDAERMMRDYHRIGALPARRMFYIPEHMRAELHPSRQVVAVTLALAVLLSLHWMHSQKDGMPRPSGVRAPHMRELAVIRAPRCLENNTPAWPPCYHALPRQPLKTIMELGQ